MSRTLAIIQREHRALAAVLYTFDHVLAEIRAGKIEPDFALFDAVLSYVQDFPDRYHHPKEDEVLFPLVVKRAPEMKALIEELQAQHHEGIRLTSDLKWKLDAWKADPKKGFASFDETAQKFIDWQRKHLAKEERTVLPTAREKLLAADWIGADAAFADNDDPIFGANPKKVYDQLLSKIASLAPEPYGLAQRKEPKKPEPITPSRREQLVQLHWI
ncbi:MAG TPA: hemerythrin domain-containing protein [Alphaproteobacteria bacterium]|jgi:branched-chain amino acid transport system ATP-binding protein